MSAFWPPWSDSSDHFKRIPQNSSVIDRLEHVADDPAPAPNPMTSIPTDVDFSVEDLIQGSMRPHLVQAPGFRVGLVGFVFCVAMQENPSDLDGVPWRLSVFLLELVPLCWWFERKANRATEATFVVQPYERHPLVGSSLGSWTYARWLLPPNKIRK